LIVHLYLTINRPDLARKEYDRAHKSSWANDDLLLQHIEASIGLVSGKDSYLNTYSFYNEQLLNPSVSSSNYHLLTARGTANLLKTEYASAASDFEESLRSGPRVESLIGSLAAAGHLRGKRDEADAIWR
jgi:coatomer protein complex subunit epsilon